jgi:hypothetical protein
LIGIEELSKINDKMELRMLGWMAILVFGFSIFIIWQQSSRKKRDRLRKLKDIRAQIEANEKAKASAHSKEKG